MCSDHDLGPVVASGERVGWTQFGGGFEGAGLHVLHLDEVTEGQLGIVGGKSASLARGLRNGLPVPPGFCITSAAFKQFLATCPESTKLNEALAQLALGVEVDVGRLSKRVLTCLSGTSIPRATEEAVLRAWRVYGENRNYAVRSSATVEDAADHSFAGQFESFLNVRGRHALLEAIRACWFSLFSERALTYGLKQGLPPHRIAMAVLVQQMVPAAAAGVLFTVDPVSGNPSQMVIEATAGLGDQLVLGRVSPERWLLDKTTLAVIDNRPTTEGPLLSDALARKVAKLGLEVEKLYGGAQDLEWAATSEDVFLLQSRPVTALRQDTKPEVWTNANIMEALPDVVTPMSWSLMQTLLESFLYPLMRRMGLKVGPPPLIRLFAGRAYLNLTGISGLVRRIGPVHADVASAFGGQYPQRDDSQRIDPAAAQPGFRALRTMGRALRIGAWLVPGLFRQEKLLERWRERVFGPLAGTPSEALSDRQLARYPLDLLKLASVGEGDRTWAAAVWMGVAAVGGSIAVFKLARRWLNDVDGCISNRLLAGAGNMNSAENGLALYRLASWARERPSLTSILLASDSFSDLQTRLENVEWGDEFLAKWRAFMLAHGHQARGGMDIAQPRWSEIPDQVLQLIRNCLQVREAADPLRLQSRRLQERARLMTECRRRLRNPLKQIVFFCLLRASQRGLRQRENVKNEGVRMIAVLRRAMLEAGRRLARRGLLNDPGDVFFVRFQELESLLGATAAIDVTAEVAARRALHERHRKLRPPPVIVGTHNEAAPAVSEDTGDSKTLQGVPVSPGIVTGKARVILQANTDAHVLPGEILVAPYTDPGWTPYFLPAAGLVVEIGGLLSHGSVVAREFGLPAVVNVADATRRIRTGDLIEVNANHGQVRILQRAKT